MSELKSRTPKETLDVLGRVCPYPIVLIKKEMQKLRSGEILKILSDSLSSIEDAVPRYCEKHGYPLEIVKLEDKGYWELYILKT